MVRQSVSLTTPNDAWLNSLIDSEEYGSKSEVINDLIRRARVQQDELTMVRAKLAKAEKSGFVTQSKEGILAEFKEELRRNGGL